MSFRRWLLVICIILLLGGFFALPNEWALAQNPTGETPTPTRQPYQRQTTLNIDVDQFTWWIINWYDNSVACKLSVEHPDYPTSAEVLYACGNNVYSDFINTRPCKESSTIEKQSCQGVYLHLLKQERIQKEVKIELPMPDMWIWLNGCNPKPPDNRCTTLPGLTFLAREPLPNESILSIQGSMLGEPFTCPGSTCTIPLKPTGAKGGDVEFWAVSSFGDTSVHYTARVRVLPWGDFMSPEGPATDHKLYYVDVLSSQWRGERPAVCSDVWGAFPDVSGLPQWLSTPGEAKDLYSNVSFYYLAGMLIQNGFVDAGICPNNGLQGDMVANTCGVQAAMPDVVKWQNSFDKEILRVAHDTGVPAQLMKNIFSRESQFWPGLYRNYLEAGLGQLTEKGADTVLLWNQSFFNQFCPLVLSKEACQKPFYHLTADEQNMLRGALVSKVNASCTSCAQGIDLRQANISVNVFAEGLQANCVQVNQTIQNISGRTPGEVATYNDLWRFTLVNYNAGVGCLGNALQEAVNNGDALDWAHVIRYLEPACRSAVKYVEDVIQVPGEAPTPTPWISLDATPTPTPDPLKQNGWGPYNPTGN